MITVCVLLTSAITGKTNEIARMQICNDGKSEDPKVGSYEVQTLRGRHSDDLDKQISTRTGKVANYRRLDLHVWNLVARALNAMEYK